MAGGGGAAGEGGGEGGWQRRSYCSTARSGLRGRGPRGRAGAPEAGPVADRGGTNTGPRRVCQHWHRRRGGHPQPPRRRKGAEAPTARQSVGRGRRGSAGHCQWRAARRGGRPGSHGTSRAACRSADGINVAADGTPRGRVGGAERPSRGKTEGADARAHVLRGRNSDAGRTGRIGQAVDTACSAAGYPKSSGGQRPPRLVTAVPASRPRKPTL